VGKGLQLIIHFNNAVELKIQQNACPKFVVNGRMESVIHNRKW
jgi:hypothetical protein